MQRSQRVAGEIHLIQRYGAAEHVRLEVGDDVVGQIQFPKRRKIVQESVGQAGQAILRELQSSQR